MYQHSLFAGYVVFHLLNSWNPTNVSFHFTRRDLQFFRLCKTLNRSSRLLILGLREYRLSQGSWQLKLGLTDGWLLRYEALLWLHLMTYLWRVLAVSQFWPYTFWTQVIEHKPYDHRADVFSYAIVLWELLTGEVSPLFVCLSQSLNGRSY